MMGQGQPFFSIIVPTYARPRQLTACLQSLVSLNYPNDRFEVIVVDDGSETPMEGVVASFRDRLNVTPLRQGNAGPAVARNTGAAASRGDILAFTDDDCRPDPFWLQTIAASFRGTPDAAIGGRTINALPSNPYSTASQLLVSFLYAYYSSGDKPGSFFTSNNLAVPVESFRALGGFDSNFRLAGGEDRDFCDRWFQSGGRLVYAPDAVVYHEHPLALRTFWRQHFNYGRGGFRFHQARALRGAGRVKTEPLSFYLDILRYPFQRPHTTRDSFVISALLLMSQVANAAGFLFEQLSRAIARGSGTGGPRPSTSAALH